MKILYSFFFILLNQIIYSQDTLKIFQCNHFLSSIFYSENKSYTINETCSALICKETNESFNISFLKKIKKRILDIYFKDNKLYILEDETILCFDKYTHKLIFKINIPCGFMKICDIDNEYIYLSNVFTHHILECPNNYSIATVSLKTRETKLLNLVNQFEYPSMIALDNQMISYQNNKFYHADFSNYKVLIYNKNLTLVDSIVDNNIKLEPHPQTQNFAIDNNFQKIDVQSSYFKTGHIFNHIIGLTALPNDTVVVYRREKIDKSANLNNQNELNPYKINELDFEFAFDYWFRKNGEWKLIETVKPKNSKFIISFIVSNYNIKFKNSNSIEYTQNFFNQNSKPELRLMSNIKLK